MVTTQPYALNARSHYDGTRMSEGTALACVGVSPQRAITGGTDRFNFKKTRGEGRQTSLGFNAQEGASLSFAANAGKR